MLKNINQPKETMFTRDAMIKGIAKATAKDKAKKNQPKETMKKEINKARKLINENPKNNHNLTNDNIKDFLNSFDNFNQAFDFINAHNKLCKSSFFFHA